MAKKLQKLRHGQEITAEFLNDIVSMLNGLANDHEQAEINERSADEKLGSFETKLNEISDKMKEVVDNVPNFTELLAQYLLVTNGTFTVTDQIRTDPEPTEESDRKAAEFASKGTLDFVIVNNIDEITMSNDHPEKTVYIELNPEHGNNIYLSYGNALHNLTLDSSEHDYRPMVPTISIEDGFWKIGNTVTTWPTQGPEGPRGAQGPKGSDGEQGPRGVQGLRGPQGVQGSAGRTPKVMFTSSSNSAHTDWQPNVLIPGHKYLGLKFVYEDDPQAKVDATPWNWITVRGDTYYPHYNASTGMLYFTTESPTSTESFSIKGDKGDQGPVGPAPYIAFKNGEDIYTELTRESENTVIDGKTYRIFNASLFKGDQGPQGEQGPRGLSGRSLFTENGQPGDYKGLDGDTYIDLETEDIYVKQNGKWNKVGTLKGSKGDKGEKGNDGTSVRILTNAESCENLGDGYIDNGHLKVLTSLDPRTFTDAGQIQGPRGLQGPQGEQGPKGDDGTNGTKILVRELGGESPSASIGSDGDVLLDKDSYKLYEKQDGTWVQIIETLHGSNGYTPTIGSNGNWYIGGTDTEKRAVASEITIVNKQICIDGVPTGDFVDGKSLHYGSDPLSVYLNQEIDPSVYKKGDLLITSDYYLMRAEQPSGSDDVVWQTVNNVPFRGNQIFHGSATTSQGITSALAGSSLKQGDCYIGDDNYVWFYDGTSWNVHVNMKGSPGQNAGFGTPTASVTNLPSGNQPTVSVTSSGSDQSKVFAFSFGIPAGIQGVPGQDGDYVAYYLGSYQNANLGLVCDAARNYFQTDRPYGQTCYGTYTSNGSSHYCWFLSTKDANSFICMRDNKPILCKFTNSQWYFTELGPSASTVTADNFSPVPGLWTIEYTSSFMSNDVSSVTISINDPTKTAYSALGRSGSGYEWNAVYDPGTHSITIYESGTMVNNPNCVLRCVARYEATSID